MLPGFRFLFAAIVLSMSVLVFGLGAAAVLRAAHEQFAESGSWRPAPDTSAAQQGEMSRPVLAMLRVDQPPAAAQADTTPVTPPGQPAEVAPSPEPEKTAALESPAASPPETAKAETKTDTKPDTAELAKAEVAPEPSKADDKETQPAAIAALPAASEPAHQDAPAAQAEASSATDTKTAAVDPAPAAAPAPTAAPAISPPPADEPATVSTSEAFPAAPEHPSTPAAANPARSGIAPLGGPPIVIEQPAADKAVRADPDPSEVKKERDKARADERARRRRLAARRARQAQEAAAQQAANPFGQTNQTLQYVQPSQVNASARAR